MLIGCAVPYGHEAQLIEIAEVSKRPPLSIGRAARAEPAFGTDPGLFAEEWTWSARGNIAGIVGVEGVNVLQEHTFARGQCALGGGLLCFRHDLVPSFDGSTGLPHRHVF